MMKRGGSKEQDLLEKREDERAEAAAAADTSHHFSMFGLSPKVIAVLASLTWATVSSALILLNKDLLSNGFPYPMALSGLGMTFSGAASYFVCRVSAAAR